MKRLRIRYWVLYLLSLIIFLSCKKKDEGFYNDYVFDFNENAQGWNILFSDYPVGDESNLELSFQHAALPKPLDTTVKSMRVSGNNHSDDLLSMLWRRIDGLDPNSTYSVRFSIDMASNACSNCAGAGGSPNLCLGAGAIAFQPGNHITSGATPYYRPNFSSAIQSCQSNGSLKVLGKIGVGEGLALPYSLINRNNNDNPILVSTNGNGELWVLIGTDSGFEGITTLFYKRITVQVKKL